VLVVAEGDQAGRRFEVADEPLTLGTGPGCQIRFEPAPGIAEEHARIWYRDGKLMVHELAGRPRGGGAATAAWLSLAPGDSFEAGPYKLHVEAG
jgi:hypothetical protein